MLRAAVLLLAACVPASPRHRGDISNALVERTGHGIGEVRDGPSLPPGIRLDDGLSSDEAVGVALLNNGDLQATLASLGFAAADLADAGALSNPVFSFLFPLGPKQIEMALAFGIDWIWKRPYRVAAASLDMERVAEDLVANGLDTALKTELAHAELEISRRRLSLSMESAATWERIAALARARLAAGAASKLEVTAVESDARTARLEEARQTGAVREREADLLDLMNPPRDVIADLSSIVLTPSSIMERSTEIAARIDAALAARPEVRGAELAIQASGERAGLATAEIFSLVASIDSNGPGKSGFEAGPGISLALPIFYQNQGGHERADAELLRATWRYASVRSRIERDVRVASHRLAGTKAALDVWPTEVIVPLEENVGRAERAYAAGGASYLEVLDANRRLIEARLRNLDLLLEAQRASALLARSMGGRLYAKN